MKVLKQPFLSCVLVGMLTLALQAQDITKGSITGVVRDPTGAVVPGATVLLESPTGSRSAKTDGTGLTRSRT